jgi:hypothetical protein
MFSGLLVSVNVVDDQQPVLVGRQRQPSKDLSYYYIRVKLVSLKALQNVRRKLTLGNSRSDGCE